MGKIQSLWNEKSVAKEAKKYKGRRDFKYGSRGAFGYAKRNGILDTVCEHMLSIKAKRWNAESIAVGSHFKAAIISS